MSFKSTLKSKGLSNLLTLYKLKFDSSEAQLANGTISMTGKLKKQKVSYQITANGSVISNKFVARRVDNYKDGIKAVSELVSKRIR